LEFFEAGGMSLVDAVNSPRKQRLACVKHVLSSFEIWGSYNPILKATRDLAADLSYYHNYGDLKLKEFIARGDDILA